MKAATLITLLVTLLTGATYAQGPCPTAFSTTENLTLSHDVICTVPQVYGAGGLVGAPNNGPLGSTDQNSAAFKHSVHFQDSSLASFAPLTTEIGTALSQLPFTSPASGYIFVFNSSMGVYAKSAENFGPILTERAETIGKHKLFVGVSYQYFNFDKVDGVNLRNFPAVFQHEQEACPIPNPNNITCIMGTNGSVPEITKDYVQTTNRIDLKVHQVTAVATFGLTDRFDLSLAVPFLNMRMDMTSSATINNLEATDPTIIPRCCVHQFTPPPITIPGETLGQLVTQPAGYPYNYSYYGSASFFRANSASGIGDVVVRAKYRIFKGEKIRIAAGGDFRAPTGDQLNFLGSGTWGIRQFGTVSVSGRFAPHATVGYQFNGSSVLGGSVASYTSARLPEFLTYSFGADVGISTKVSLSGDFLGQTVRDAKKIAISPTTTLVNDGSVVQVPGLVISTSTSNQESIAVGGKVSPVGKLIITAHVLFRVNDAGLHSKPVPLVGLSYVF